MDFELEVWTILIDNVLLTLQVLITEEPALFQVPCNNGPTLLKQTIEKSIYKDCGEGKVLIRLKIQS